MEKLICIYDKSGTLINIGPWDYMEFPVYDNDGFLIEIEVGNPLPEGATEKEEDVQTNEDGSRSVVTQV